MTTQKEYVELWNNHIDELKRIGYNLESLEEIEEIEELQEELKEIVKKASENLEGDN